MEHDENTVRIKGIDTLISFSLALLDSVPFWIVHKT